MTDYDDAPKDTDEPKTKKKSKREDDDILKDAKEAFELAQDNEHDNRAEALEDIRFSRLGEQWPEKIRRQREKDGRPCLTIPRLTTFIRQVVNDGRQNKPSIKVHPADSKADPQTAEIYDGLIRHIEVSSHAGAAYDTALEYAVSGGVGYFRINTKFAHDDTFDLDIMIDRVANPFSIYGDPYSTSATSEDWNSAFVVERLPIAEFKRKYKGAEVVDWDAGLYDQLQAPWKEDNEILIAEWWVRELYKKQALLLSDQQVMDEETYEKNKANLNAIGVTVVGSRSVDCHKLCQYLLTGAEVLETNERKGRFIPIVPVYGDEVNVEGERFFRSLTRDAKDAQRMFNYWRSATTELVALAPKAPYVGRKGFADTDQHKWETANSEAHSYIEYDGPEPPIRQQFAGVPAGALQEALNASDDMKSIMGLYDASLGAKSNETSGRAIMARQREGDVSTFHFIDNLSRAIEHAGRILIDLIPKVYTGDRIVRVLGQDSTASSIQLGKPVPQTDPKTGQPMTDPNTGAPLSRVFDLGAGKYDLTVTAGPSFTSRREESAQQMIELIRAFPAAAPIMGDLLAKNLDWPGADEISKRLQMLQQQMMQGQQGGQPQDPAAMAQVQADAQKAQMENRIAMLELKLKAFEADTERMKVLADAEANRQRAMNPPQPKKVA